jgi:hypothetical protein
MGMVYTLVHLVSLAWKMQGMPEKLKEVAMEYPSTGT